MELIEITPQRKIKHTIDRYRKSQAVKHNGDGTSTLLQERYHRPANRAVLDRILSDYTDGQEPLLRMRAIEMQLFHLSYVNCTAGEGNIFTLSNKYSLHRIDLLSRLVYDADTLSSGEVRETWGYLNEVYLFHLIDFLCRAADKDMFAALVPEELDVSSEGNTGGDILILKNISGENIPVLLIEVTMLDASSRFEKLTKYGLVNKTFDVPVMVLSTRGVHFKFGLLRNVTFIKVYDLLRESLFWGKYDPHYPFMIEEMKYPLVYCLRFSLRKAIEEMIKFAGDHSHICEVLKSFRRVVNKGASRLLYMKKVN